MKKYLFFLFAVFFILFFYSCKKENETYTGSKLVDYYPLEYGKYITYKLDSLVYLSFGTIESVNSYEAKYVVDSLITDNLGRPAYRIFRFIRKQSTDPWFPSGTFMAVNTNTSIEFIENNLRYIKLALPFENNNSWKGNQFIDTWSLNSELKYLNDWDYAYNAIAEAATIGSYHFDNIITVQQRNEELGDPQDPYVLYSERNFAEEKYAEGIGLVYRNFSHYEFQRPDTLLPGYYADGSYGVTLTMIDHN